MYTENHLCGHLMELIRHHPKINILTLGHEM